MSEEYDDCGRDIGRPEDVLAIRYKTIPEAADMMRVAGEKLAHMIFQTIDQTNEYRPNGMAKSRWNYEVGKVIDNWNEAHEAFVIAMARDGE